jgi:hypothetical protein
VDGTETGLSNGGLSYYRCSAFVFTTGVNFSLSIMPEMKHVTLKIGKMLISLIIKQSVHCKQQAE